MTDINAESIGLFLPEIDDRSEEQLYQNALRVVANRSRGDLSDFSDHNPLGVMLRSQAFASAELLYKANKLPLALVLKLLELTGTQRNLGSKAQVTVTFNLTAPRTVPFVIPKGFEVVDSTGQYSFFTETQLTIPAGSASGSVDAIAAEKGTAYNLPAYTINQFTQPLAFLASVINVRESQGGDVEESIESAIERGLKQLRRRNPVSRVDFEEAAQDILGPGSRAKAIGLLDGNKQPNIPGAVHVFCLSALGEPANPALINDVYSQLLPQMMLGTALYVSPMELTPIECEVVSRLLPEANPTVVANDLWNVFRSFLAPTAYVAGTSLLIQELRHQLRFVRDLQYIDEIRLNDGVTDIPMPNQWTLPQAYSLSMTLVDAEGNIFNILRGEGHSIDFVPPD